MTVADVLTWLLLTAGTCIALVGAWLATHALWPNAVARFGDELARPVRATAMGLLTSVPLFAIGAAAADRGTVVWLLGVLGLALLLVLLVTAVAGAAGLARRIGNGLASPVDDSQPWRRTLRGGVVLAASFLLPFAGWFVLLPLALVSGFGAVVLAARKRGTAA